MPSMTYQQYKMPTAVTTTTDRDLYVLDQSKLKQKTATVAKGNGTRSVYQYLDTNLVATALDLTVDAWLQGGSVWHRRTLAGRLVWTDSVTGLISVGEPFSGTVEIRLPQNPNLVPNDIRIIEDVITGLGYPSLTAGVPSLTHYANMIGVVSELYG